MQSALPKQYLQVLGKTLLQHTLENLGSSALIAGIVLAVSPGDPHISAALAKLAPELRARITLVAGGAERVHSVRNAVAALAGGAAASDWVLVHDAVRPCVLAADLPALLAAVSDEPAGGLLALPVRDTLKRDDGSAHVLATVDRQSLWQAATPQVFRHGVLSQALDNCMARGLLVTDEAAAVEALGLPVKLVQGRSDNIKLTWPEDLALVEAVLRSRLQYLQA